MNLAIRYAALLIVLLLTMFIAGNPTFTEDGGSTLHVFPNLLSVLSIPLVITILVVHIYQRSEVEFTRLQGISSGELASRWSAITFAFAVGMYALGFSAASANAPNVTIVLFTCSTAFVATYLIGLITTILITIVVQRRK